MFLSRIFNSLHVSMQEQYVSELLELNEKTKQYDLALTLQDVQLLMAARSQILYSYGRVELSIEVTKELNERRFASGFAHESRDDAHSE